MSRGFEDCTKFRENARKRWKAYEKKHQIPTFCVLDSMLFACVIAGTIRSPCLADACRVPGACRKSGQDNVPYILQ